ncbi:hypothetical protein BASA81_000168 [Batrachochytrium salamandrivorans]|nr:hypothetical protein BASA81_000168 [Batrachochytrium salamandrivorans]
MITASGYLIPFPRPAPPPKRTTPYALPEPVIEPFAFNEACISKAVMASAMGSVFGAGLGFLMGSYQNMSPPIGLPGVPNPPDIPLRYALKESWLSTARKARRWGRNMLVVGFLLSGSECCIEKFRAKHDIYNSVLGGGLTGATLAARQGPWGMFFGAVGFACFGAISEYFMGH